MSKKNFTVATVENGKTTKQDTKHAFATTNISKDKTPTGKVKTIKDKEALKKEREEQYKNFRIGALKRRAKRIGLSEGQIKVKIEELIKQIDTPNQYFVLVMFDAKDKDTNTQALKNEGIVCKIQGPTYFYIEADQDTLGTIRSIMTPGSKIHPYVKKKPSVLPVQESPKKSGYVAKNNDKSNTHKGIRNAQRAKVVAAAYDVFRELKKKAEAEGKEFTLSKSHLTSKYNSICRAMKSDASLASAIQNKVRYKKLRKQEKAQKLFEKRCCKRARKIVQLKPKKGSNASKKASTNLKKAA